MDIVQLRYFKTVAETEHLTKAAKLLNVAQPALSVSISRLENEVGVQLFDRQGRRIQLNPYGKAYLNRVEQVLHTLDQAQNELLEMKNKNENVMFLGLVSKLFTHSLLIGFKKQFPMSRIRSYDVAPDEIEEELLGGDVDYILASQKPENPELEAEEIYQERYLLATSADSRYAGCNQLALSDLREEQFISLPDGYEHRQITDELCKKHGFTPSVTMECFHCHMAGLIAAGMGVALVTEGFMKENRANKQLVFIPITDEDCVRHYYLLWKKGHTGNQMTRNFRLYVKEHYRQHCMRPACNCSRE